MEASTSYDGKIFCLITGASKGFGRSVALAFARLCKFTEGSVFLLVGRDESGLNETKRLIQSINAIISIQIEVCDLEDMAAVETFGSRLSDFDKTFDSVILVNNAGSLGDISKKLTTPSSSETLRKYFDLNLLSVILLIQNFVAAFKSNKKVLVNISSLCAIQEMPYMSCYCIAKAARDMLHKVVSCEDEEARVLNYAPGPMETAMSLDVQKNCGNEDTRKSFKDMRDNKKIINPDHSADKLIRLLREDKFNSGDHIDFYDIK